MPLLQPLNSWPSTMKEPRLLLQSTPPLATVVAPVLPPLVMPRRIAWSSPPPPPGGMSVRTISIPLTRGFSTTCGKSMSTLPSTGDVEGLHRAHAVADIARRCRSRRGSSCPRAPRRRPADRRTRCPGNRWRSTAAPGGGGPPGPGSPTACWGRRTVTTLGREDRWGGRRQVGALVPNELPPGAGIGAAVAVRRGWSPESACPVRAVVGGEHRATGVDPGIKCALPAPAGAEHVEVAGESASVLVGDGRSTGEREEGDALAHLPAGAVGVVGDPDSVCRGRNSAGRHRERGRGSRRRQPVAGIE